MPDLNKFGYFSFGKTSVEIIDGLEIGDVVYILPSKSLFDYQERFKKRVEGSFSFG